MAVPNEIQAPRYNALLHKLLSMSEGAPAPSLAPDMFSSIVLENDRPEWSFLKAENRAFGFAASAAVAATKSMVALYAPAGVVVVTSLIYSSTANLDILIRRVSGFPSLFDSTGVERGSTDTRHGPETAAQLLTEQHATPPGTLNGRLYTLARTFTPCEYIIGPDTAIVWQHFTTNTALNMCVSWYERAMEPSETR